MNWTAFTWTFLVIVLIPVAARAWGWAVRRLSVLVDRDKLEPALDVIQWVLTAGCIAGAAGMIL